MIGSDVQPTASSPPGTMIPEIVRVDDPVAWNRYVHEHPHGTFYHRFEWLGLIARVFRHQVFPYAALSDSRIVGIFPLVYLRSSLFGRMLVSMPYVNYGGILADSLDTEQRLWKAAVQTAAHVGATSLEARHSVPHAFISQGKHHKVGMTLSLAPSIEIQWKGFNAKLRNQIRKSELSGLSLRIGGVTEVGPFYDVFARNMRDLGTPVYSRNLFERVLQTFPETCRVFTVWNGRRVVAGAIAVAHRDTLEVPWAASRRDALSLCPNHRLYWELIQHAIKAGFRRFDFGRSSPDSGPYKFKEQWGAQPVPQFWEYWTATGELPNVSPQNPRYAMAVQAWKRLPVRVANWLGPSIVRNIP